jgi:non-ribosomal peptide synthetase component E (peptide arylation enzyme)
MPRRMTEMVKPSNYSQEEMDNFIEQRYWDRANSLDVWERNAEKYPNDEAVVDSKSRLTWSEVKRLSDRIAISFLELGIEKDGILVIQLPNCVELPVLRLACEKAGVIPLLAGRALRSVEIKSLIRQSSAVGVIVPWQFRDFDYIIMIERIQPELPSLKHIFVVGDKVPKGKLSIKELMQQPLESKYPPDFFSKTRIGPTEVCSIVHTSGTTGMPKLIERVGARTGASRDAIEKYNLTREDIFGAFSPAVTGSCEVHSYLTMPYVGAKCIMMEHFDAEGAFKLIERERISIASVVPAQLTMMLDHPNLDKYDLSSWKSAFSHASPLTYPTAVKFEERTGCRIMNVYGTMELSGVSTTSVFDPRDVRLLTVGKPYFGNEIKIVDDAGKEVEQGEVGQIVIRGPFASAGYYKAPELNEKVWTDEKWLKIDDYGKLDAEGNLIIIGRTDDVILRGGQNIYPAEIETLLADHPKIERVAVVGMPDRIMGQKCCVFVVPRYGKIPTFEEIVTSLKNKGIAPYKLPERLKIIDELPHTKEQKIDKKMLRVRIAQELEGEVK